MPRKNPPAPPALDQFDELELEIIDMEIVGRLLLVHEEQDVQAYLAERVAQHAGRARVCFDECHAALKRTARAHRERPVPPRTAGVASLVEARELREGVATLLADAAADDQNRGP